MLTRAFGRDEWPIGLKVRGWREVEKTCDLGLGEIAARLAPLVNLIEVGAKNYPGGIVAAIAAGHLGSARLDDVRAPILEGLIDGGMPTTEAGALVRMIFDEAAAAGEAPLLRWAGLAFEIVSHAMIGLKDEPMGETPAAPRPEGRRPLPNGKTRFAEIYGAAAIMGFGPAEADTWEPYQFAAAWRAWRAAKTPPTPKAPSDEEYRAAVARTVH
jgi:hypothetical protein